MNLGMLEYGSHITGHHYGGRSAAKSRRLLDKSHTNCCYSVRKSVRTHAALGADNFTHHK